MNQRIIAGLELITNEDLAARAMTRGQIGRRRGELGGAHVVGGSVDEVASECGGVGGDLRIREIRLGRRYECGTRCCGLRPIPAHAVRPCQPTDHEMRRGFRGQRRGQAVGQRRKPIRETGGMPELQIRYGAQRAQAQDGRRNLTARGR